MYVKDAGSALCFIKVINMFWNDLIIYSSSVLIVIFVILFALKYFGGEKDEIN